MGPWNQWKALTAETGVYRYIQISYNNYIACLNCNHEALCIIYVRVRFAMHSALYMYVHMMHNVTKLLK